MYILHNIGIVTDKNFLTVTRLNFGRAQLATGLQLGRLRCWEKWPSLEGQSFAWICGGSAVSGLYSVMGTELVESVYCDFIKLPTD